ncbi:SDR family NAD(P)-dependent oxidoreductase [Streptomyces ipomoeae]|jgi:short-subunit dehydrogenase|uniref:Oxidoreductase, short chain dehydrogenase/reductase family protein n=1 Tax=Streptomyces ipomoeae 91-03 TaxID=698759 RepID=L1KSH9_9ACTN|nr:SDR family NAD(P)-dependent oxidoreductase [Streptomyces ipomoeae]EKX63313.1 oxidoreductase, short chain dehydrogenase/reductase family protein [Streptomyces ipomoeae 91-03]MDX2697781.1 SDR family NAD(P)-dependent oxidoreductase [Streptomyces ipomoeae]MDX2822580.1 SDR family NAD(P)-dependent oxidoreductase [Streptomyces ipomoeae]MDX2844058.1 SDR family NAD(P)-dependent oxidoreductase [Streptomyces ipomoeae]MDX2877840.1 SDR family NAD(P)-dependent oxidoreductase [Streptomyces ipomoeae]
MSDVSKVIAVFGAGTGLGVSVARRFGREGFRVALVARRKDRLDALVARLADEGVEAAAFPADLSNPAVAPALVDAIRDHFGRIDVVEYAPIAGDQSFTPATALDAATLEKLSRLFLLTPVEVFRAVLPEMTERGDGALLMTTGYSAVRPMPHLSGVGPVMSAARNYLHSLNGELADKGVYAGTLSVAAMITGSEAAEAVEAGSGPLAGGRHRRDARRRQAHGRRRGRTRRALLGHVHQARPRRAGPPRRAAARLRRMTTGHS